MFVIRKTQKTFDVVALNILLIVLLLYLLFSYFYLKFAWSLFLLLLPSSIFLIPTWLISFVIKGNISKYELPSVSSSIINSYLIFCSIAVSIALFTKTLTWEYSLLILLGITVIFNFLLILLSSAEKLKPDRIFVIVVAAILIPYWIFPTIVFCKIHFRNFPYIPLFITAWFYMICLTVLFMIIIIKSRAFLW